MAKKAKKKVAEPKHMMKVPMTDKTKMSKDMMKKMAKMKKR